MRKVRYAHTQKDALNLLAELKEKYTTSSHLDADHMTTGQWINKWLDLYVTPRVRASTQNLYYGGHAALCHPRTQNDTTEQADRI